MVKRHLPSVHAYADDTQLYLAFKPDCALSTNEAISAMEVCVREIIVWVLCDKLKINEDKTEVIIYYATAIGKGSSWLSYSWGCSCTLWFRR